MNIGHKAKDVGGCRKIVGELNPTIDSTHLQHRVADFFLWGYCKFVVGDDTITISKGI